MPMSLFFRLLHFAPFRRLTVAALFVVVGVCGASASAGANAGGVQPNAVGMLDCNGYSPIQHSLKASMGGADPRSIENGQGARFKSEEGRVGKEGRSRWAPDP